MTCLSKPSNNLIYHSRSAARVSIQVNGILNTQKSPRMSANYISFQQASHKHIITQRIIEQHLVKRAIGFLNGLISKNSNSGGPLSHAWMFL